ncbi:U6 snRNA-associated Sm-like protein LSm4 isoform X2 [Lepus europaeus]|uniref:U6 snRNA-associated Sm-like protein LSm4 isoform X2 n=2 Tax=Lepus europaeus TaxID=9983 RepID=UPI002B46EB60|nr:U6 snRNA-associated Sm-like protein LSm4 isoform X2 [Lepus europaeus]
MAGGGGPGTPSRCSIPRAPVPAPAPCGRPGRQRGGPSAGPPPPRTRETRRRPWLLPGQGRDTGALPLLHELFECGHICTSAGLIQPSALFIYFLHGKENSPHVRSHSPEPRAPAWAAGTPRALLGASSPGRSRPDQDAPRTPLPLSLLKTAQNHPMLVELKNGETYNGHLVSCDNWMNINLREVICTSRDGDKFWRMPECYIRGSTIKYLRIPDEIIDMVKEEVVAKGRGRGGLQQQKQQKGRGLGGAGRGVFGGRGRGGIPGTGRGQPEKKPGRQAGKQ